MKLFQTSFGDALEFANGKALPEDAIGDLVPVYGSNGCIGRAKVANHSKGVILGRVGAYCGSVAYCASDFWATDNTIVVYPKPGHHIGFLYYFLLQQSLNRYAGGSAQPLLTQKILKPLPASLPEFDDQARAWQVLSAYDDLIATNQRRIALLEDAARRLYREWFVHLRFPGHEQVAVKDGVPQGWQIQTLASVAAVNARAIGSRDKPDSLLYIDISSVSTGLIGTVTPYAFAEAPGRARRRVVHGDVIWSCVRPNRRSYALIWEPDEKLVVSTGFAVLSATTVPFSYLYFTTTTDAFVGHLEQNATGAAYPAVTAKTFEDAEILVPDADVLVAFDSVVLPQLEQMETLKQQNVQLAQARDLLLPKLMSGRLDVSGIRLPEEMAA
ncbi:MAG TPA: restriction endonuclease subunit S [Alicycliphilus sp.]|nr:restriction endonuclease subunit S [Alicycliphilus sp.]